jgi:pyruvate/2-oxoglutarate/acetoin dehydrogenase E1 component
MIFSRALGEALRNALEVDDRVVVLGEDIADPYGGAFKVTKGLTTDFPGRVRTTPVSESAIVGVAAGLALEGYRPIVEIMFGDFIGLAFDQIANHIAKYESMYNGQVTCPVIIRTPSGGGRGYGPTHSQSLEKHFLGIPHLKTVAASLLHDPRRSLRELLERTSPVLYVEHKLLYPLHVFEPDDERLRFATVTTDASPEFPETVSMRFVPREECVLTVLAYGFQAELARRVVERLAIESEIFCELLVPGQIAPLDWAPIERSVAATGSLVVVEEGTAGWSWGTQIAAEVSARLFDSLRQPVTVATSAADVIPSSRDAEAEMLMGEAKIDATLRAAAA